MGFYSRRDNDWFFGATNLILLPNISVKIKSIIKYEVLFPEIQPEPKANNNHHVW